MVQAQFDREIQNELVIQQNNSVRKYRHLQQLDLQPLSQREFAHQHLQLQATIRSFAIPL